MLDFRSVVRSRRLIFRTALVLTALAPGAMASSPASSAGEKKKLPTPSPPPDWTALSPSQLKRQVNDWLGATRTVDPVIPSTTTTKTTAVTSAAPVSGSTGSGAMSAMLVGDALSSDCDGSVSGITVTHVGSSPLAAQDIGVAEVQGCFPEGTTFSWSGDGMAISGSDARVNVLTSNVASMTVEGCAIAPGGGSSSCATASTDLGAARPRVRLTSVTSVADYGYGKVQRIQGTVSNASSSDQVIVFKHSDVHYIVNPPISVGTDGHFSVDVFAMNNVDRFVVTLAGSGFSLATHGGCNSSWCFGAVDPLTGHNVPVVPNTTDLRDFQTQYLPTTTADPDGQINALMGLFGSSAVAGPAQPAALVQTDWENSQRFLYDQALAAIAFSYAGEQAPARKILNALVDLQLSDGSWYFMYNANGTSPFPAAGDVRYTGAVAWAVMAFNAYQSRFSGLEYESTVHAALTYLNGLRTTVGSATAVRFNPTNLSLTSWDETQVVAFEHNADTYSAFMGDAANTGTELFPGAAASLKSFLGARWNGSYFDPGVDLTWGENTTDVYLDPMTWGVLALGSAAVPYYGGLDFACDSFVEPAGYVGDQASIHGFFDYQRSDGTKPYGRFAWSEGTLGAVLALDQVDRDSGTPLSCDTGSADDFFDSTTRLVGFNGAAGVPESTLTSDPSYDTVTSAAGTAWYYLAKVSKNPFRPWEAL